MPSGIVTLVSLSQDCAKVHKEEPPHKFLLRLSLRLNLPDPGAATILPPMSSEGANAFIARWAAASASERANSQPFLCELCYLLGVARPEPTRETGCAF